MDEFTIGTIQTDEAEFQEVENEDYECFKTSENTTCEHQDWEDGMVN
jgi:hypothetical protein